MTNTVCHDWNFHVARRQIGSQLYPSGFVQVARFRSEHQLKFLSCQTSKSNRDTGAAGHRQHRLAWMLSRSSGEYIKAYSLDGATHCTVSSNRTHPFTSLILEFWTTNFMGSEMANSLQCSQSSIPPTVLPMPFSKHNTTKPTSSGRPSTRRPYLLLRIYPPLNRLYDLYQTFQSP